MLQLRRIETAFILRLVLAAVALLMLLLMGRKEESEPLAMPMPNPVFATGESGIPPRVVRNSGGSKKVPGEEIWAIPPAPSMMLRRL